MCRSTNWDPRWVNRLASLMSFPPNLQHKPINNWGPLRLGRFSDYESTHFVREESPGNADSFASATWVFHKHVGVSRIVVFPGIVWWSKIVLRHLSLLFEVLLVLPKHPAIAQPAQRHWFVDLGNWIHKLWSASGKPASLIMTFSPHIYWLVAGFVIPNISLPLITCWFISYTPTSWFRHGSSEPHQNLFPGARSEPSNPRVQEKHSERVPPPIICNMEYHGISWTVQKTCEYQGCRD